MTINRQIIASGTFFIDPNNPWIDLYILAQSTKKTPKICLLPTASADSPGMIKHFMQTFERYPCEPSFLELFSPRVKDIEGFILEQDIVLVGGGQSKTMMGIWKEWGVDAYLKRAYNNGTILAGGSAGSVCWFRECITDSFPGELSVMPCLNFLQYSHSPHYRSDDRRAAYHKFILDEKIGYGFGIDDGAALHFVNELPHQAITVDDEAKVYKVFRSLNNESYVVNQESLNMIDLTNRNIQHKLIWDSEPFRELLLESQSNEANEDDMKPKEQNLNG